MSSRSASALLEAALAVPFDPEEEDRRQLALAQQATWDSGPMPDQNLDIAPENVMVPQLGPDPLVQAADAAMSMEPGAGGMEQGLEPPLPQADEDLPPVMGAPAGASVGVGGGSPRRSASALLAEVLPEEPAGDGGQETGASQAAPRRPSASVLLADVPEDSSALRKAADVPIFLMQGATTGLKALADVFGADSPASQDFAERQAFWQAQLSPEAQASQQRVAQIQAEAADQGLMAQLGAAGRAFVESPTAFVAQGLGTMAPTVATAGAARAFGAGAAGVQAAQLATGAAMGGGIVKGEIYQAVEQAMLQAGRSPEEAAEAASTAQAYDGENLDMILAGYGLGFLATAIGAERLAGRAIAGAAGPTGGVLRVAGRTALQEGLPEAAQGSQEQLARNLAQQREGFEVPTMRGVAGAGALEGLAGLAIGGPAGVAAGVGAAAGRRTAGPAVPTEQAAPAATAPVRRVVVEQDDVFGEATTAAVEEPAAAPAPMGDERFAPPVVEQPVAEAAAEPVAAPVATEETPADSMQWKTRPPRVATTDLLGRPISPEQLAFNEEFLLSGVVDPSLTTGYATDFPDQAVYFAEQPQAIGGPAPLQTDRGVVRVYARQGARESTTNEFKLPAGAQPVAEFTPAQVRAGEHLKWFAEQKAGTRTAGPAVPTEQTASTTQTEPWRLTKREFFHPQVSRRFVEAESAPDGTVIGTVGDVVHGQKTRALLEPVLDVQIMVMRTPVKDGKRVDVGENYSFDGSSGRFNGRPTIFINPNERMVGTLWEEAAHQMRRAKGRQIKKTDIQQVIGNDAAFERDYRNDPEEISAKRFATYLGSLASSEKSHEQIVQEALQEGLPVPDNVRSEYAQTTAKLNIQRKLRPDSGAVDVSILEDIVEYGQTVYRAGMDLATWSAQMVKEFGQGVAQFLRQAFDRIVAAYQESIYSDETGAIGGRRPVRFKRSIAQLEALAQDSAAFRTWFDDFRTYLEQDFLAQFPEYAPLVNEFLSATSAATSVTANVPIMVKELRHFLETGEIRTNFEAHAKNLQRAVSGQKLEGPKISEYSDAVFGNPDAIPVDRHIAQIMFGVKAPSARQIAAAKRRIREIALRLNWQPRQVMAALWAANQRLNNQPSESYERHLERYKGELLSILAADRAGEGRGLQAARRIAERISAAGRTEGSPSDVAGAAAKARVKRKLTGESGAIDVSIIEDLVVYGQTVYRAGMDLATWSAVMVRDFGQGVAQFLRQAFDRIVAAYRDSRFADTTGAVGDVRPRQTKPRQLEEKAMRNEALAAETRARLGSEYLPISLNAQAEAAKEWINTNGLDAAKLRIAQLGAQDVIPTPLDFAIAIEALPRLSSAGDHQGAADILSMMSERSQGMGQTISVLAMMARLSPEGIVFYGENIIKRYINALAPEAQERIRALQAEVARLKAELAQAKFDQGSEVIRSGKLGDEKMQDRIKRRQRAKVTADLGPAASGPEVTAETRARVIRMNVAVRDVLLGDATRAEATKAIEAILLEQGNLSASEAAAMARSIADAFFKLMRETRTRLTNEAKGRGGRAGGFDRLLAALREGKELSDADFLGELSRLLGLPGMTPAMARELRAIGQRYERATDPDVRLVLAAQMYEKAHELVPADFWVKVRGFAYLSMLFAPKTWIRNVVGNQIQWIANVGRDAFVTGLLDPAMSMFTGQRTSAGLQLGARLKGLLAPVADVRRGYLWSKQENPSFNFRQNVAAGVNHLRLLSKLSTQNKYEISDVRSVNGRIFSSGFMRAWEGALSIALGAGDRAFWMSQFRASLAQMQAAAERNGEWSGQPTPEMIEAAMAEAAYAIYQNPNLLSQGGAKVRAVLNRLTTAGRTDQFGLGTALMAFTQVPGSIALRGILDWSPLGFIRAMYQGMRGVLYASSDGRRGAKFDQAEFNKTFTQALLGTGGMYAAGFWLYSLGIITASREDDEDLEAMRRASGLGAYRINLTALRRALLSMNWFTPQPPQDGDLIVTYDWAQPVAITVAAGAEYAAMLERAERSAMKKGLAERASMPVMSLVAGAKSLEELPLLSGLMSFMEAVGQPAPAGESKLANALIKTVTGLPSMFVPQLVRQATQLSDNMVRTTRAGVAAEREFDRVLASLPGWSTKYPVRFDVTGQAIERYQYGGNTVWNVLTNPALTRRYKADPVLQEVGRLLNATGETGVVPREVLRKAKINGKDVELTNNQIAAYQYYVGNFTMSHFRWRMAAPVYARLPDEVKVKMLTDDLADIHAAVKSAVLGADARRLTRKQLFLRNALVNSPLGRSVPPR